MPFPRAYVHDDTVRLFALCAAGVTLASPDLRPFAFLGTCTLVKIREWSKRVGLDGAITNLPKMSSLILRWSLDNSPPSQRVPAPPPRPPPSPPTSQGCTEADGGSGRARQRELRSSLQAFLEVRQVLRLLSGRGEADPSVLSIAGETRVSSEKDTTKYIFERAVLNDDEATPSVSCFVWCGCEDGITWDW